MSGSRCIRDPAILRRDVRSRLRTARALRRAGVQHDIHRMSRCRTRGASHPPRIRQPKDPARGPLRWRRGRDSVTYRDPGAPAPGHRRALRIPHASQAVGSLLWRHKQRSPLSGLLLSCGGEGGIRTPGTVNRTTDFESAAFDHSATSPGGGILAEALLPPDGCATPGANDRVAADASSTRTRIAATQARIARTSAPACSSAARMRFANSSAPDRKSTRLNSSHSSVSRMPSSA